MEPNKTSAALNVAVAAAREAGKLITQSIGQLDRITVSKKDNHELVSEIDLRAEQHIIELLDQSYPEFNVLSEESGDLGRESGCCWVIDPIDGTHNFLHGHPHCAISIALKVDNEVVAAVIYDAIRNELFTARKGAGAQLDERRIRVFTSQQVSGQSAVYRFSKPRPTKHQALA